MTVPTTAAGPRSSDAAHEAATRDPAEVLQVLGTSTSGLTEEEAARRLEEFGTQSRLREQMSAKKLASTPLSLQAATRW